MSRIARYGRSVAKEGRGEELAAALLRAAAEMESVDGCELYLVNRQLDAPDTVWVTELWRDQAALDGVRDQLRGSPSVAAVLALVDSFEMIELDLLGGKGLPGSRT